MNRHELIAVLKKLGVPSVYYSLSGSNTNERICLIESEGKWKVSFFERGQEAILGSFESESSACEFMLGELKRGL